MAKKVIRISIDVITDTDNDQGIESLVDCINREGELYGAYSERFELMGCEVEKDVTKLYREVLC